MSATKKNAKKKAGARRVAPRNTTRKKAPHRITAEWLKREYACAPLYRAFVRIFGKSAAVTPRNAERWFKGAPGIAGAATDWLASRLPDRVRFYPGCHCSVCDPTGDLARKTMARVIRLGGRYGFETSRESGA